MSECSTDKSFTHLHRVRLGGSGGGWRNGRCQLIFVVCIVYVIRKMQDGINIYASIHHCTTHMYRGITWSRDSEVSTGTGPPSLSLVKTG